MTKLSVVCAAAVTVLLLSPPERLEGQGHIIIVRRDHPIEADGPSLPLTEPVLAVDPVSASHLAVGTIVAPTAADSPWHCATFTSFDGGGSWTRHDFAMERCIDPWVLFSGDGAVVFIGISRSGRFALRHAVVRVEKE